MNTVYKDILCEFAQSLGIFVYKNQLNGQMIVCVPFQILWLYVDFSRIWYPHIGKSYIIILLLSFRNSTVKTAHFKITLCFSVKIFSRAYLKYSDTPNLNLKLKKIPQRNLTPLFFTFLILDFVNSQSYSANSQNNSANLQNGVFTESVDIKSFSDEKDKMAFS